jgi:hypothetical protein
MDEHNPAFGKCMIGARFILNRDCLGNKTGAMGYVFNEYQDYDDPTKIGVQIIFPNGEYDGFSWAEQQAFLTQIGVEERYTSYRFRNVIKVSRDFADGYWAFPKEIR